MSSNVFALLLLLLLLLVLVMSMPLLQLLCIAAIRLSGATGL